MHKNKTEETAVDHLEFNEMFRRNEAIVYNFIRYRILDKSLAQDVLQETFYLAYKKWDILKDHPNQTGWLLETARYKIQEFNRKIKKLECETSLDDHDDHEYVAAKDEYGKAELDMVLETELDEEEKTRFSRYFVAGYKISEIAKLENISENNMCVRLSRLRGKIAQCLYDGKIFDKKQKKSVRNDKKETAVDHLEFNEMFRRNEAIVYNFIRYRILDKSLAQDVLQETFYLAYKKWDILKDHPNQTGWLLETARYKIQEFNRKIKKLECETSLDDHDDHEYVAAKDEYGKAELDMVLETELDEEEKTRFSRYFVAGYKISEIAKLENISENNMCVRLSRLRGKIAQCLYDGKIFDKKQKKSVRNDKKETKTYREGQSFGSNAG